MEPNNSAYILSGPDEMYDIPNESIGKYIYRCLKSKDPGSIINVDPISKEILTCGKLLEESIKVTKLLKSFSIAKGDTISIISENTLTYCVPIVAALYMGVTVAPSNPLYLKDELIQCLNLSKPKLILCTETPLKQVLEAVKELDYVERIIIMGSESVTNPEIKNFEKLLENTTADLENFEPEDFDCTQQIAFVFLSSGTTGFPKGVMLSHENLRAPLGYLTEEKYGNLKPYDVTVLFLPFFHMFGMIIQLIGIVSYMKIVFMAGFNPEVFLQSIQDYKVTKLFLVPPLLLFLAKSPLVENYDVSSIQDILVGAAPIGKEIQEAATKRLKNTTIRQMYGFTEVSGATNIETINLHKPGSVGVLIPGVKAKVCDTITGKLLGPLKIGELCYKGRIVMKGYARNEAATQRCIDEDGFCHSGDIGYYDNDNYFYIVDRLKELIKYKGFQVAPAELEALINSHPQVKECGVIGIPDERSGQLPFAYVARQNGAKVSEKDIVDFVSGRISAQKHLYGGVKFIDEIPKTASGKILRRKLLELWKGS